MNKNNLNPEHLPLVLRVEDLMPVAAIESGDDIKTVQANLGHATASFTLDVYGHASQKMRQRSADRMEQYIKDVLWNEHGEKR